MNRKTALILIILIATTIPGALAETLTVSILESEDDVWMTEAGNVFGYESSVHILDGSIGLRAFLRFGDVAIAKSDKINLATLFVYAGWDQGESPDPGASVTIYGIAEPDCGPFSYSGRVWNLERPLTSASVNWNITTWPYAGWKSVNVTDIVKEIVTRYAWEENNSLGFQILGASDSGQEVRTFEDIDHQHSGNHAYLYIQYNLPPGVPPGLPPGATWVETYQDWDIWVAPPEQVEIGYTNMTEIDDPGKITVYNDTWFGWSGINKNTLKVALGYLVNLTGPDSINSIDETFNFSVNVISHDAAQVSPNTFFLMGSLYQIGTLNEIFAGNELICFDIMTTSTVGYQFLPREYGAGTGNGGLSSILSENTWYMGRVILDGTLWRLEVRNMAGGLVTACQRTLSASRDRKAVMPMAGQGHGVAGSVDSGWMTKDTPSPPTFTYFLTDENGTVIPTWNGENFTDIDDLKDYTDDVVNPQGGDPLDPAPGAGWEETGPFTRFRMRLYFMIIGISCIFVPIWAISYKRPGPQGVAWCCMLILIGLGLLISIPNI